jgi:hypothetical protein
MFVGIEEEETEGRSEENILKWKKKRRGRQLTNKIED